MEVSPGSEDFSECENEFASVEDYKVMADRAKEAIAKHLASIKLSTDDYQNSD